MTPGKVYVIGVAPDGIPCLSPKLRRMVNEAEIIFGGQRLLKMFPIVAGRKVTIKNNMSEVAGIIEENLGQTRMVVLASGDPGFYGIAKYLIGKLGSEAIEVEPAVSAMQLAFARIGESWDDAALTSVHSRPIEDIVAAVRSNHKIGILTDDKNTPDKIAVVLLKNGIDNCRAYVCQELGTSQESVIATDLNGLKEREFSPLNVLILVRNTSKPSSPQRLFGIPEGEFQQPEGEKGLITKLEVRAVDLARLSLNENSIVWDIGAGSGAVSIEAASLACRGIVYAVEKNARAVAAIRENVKRFGRSNIKVVKTTAPDGLEELPAPSSVFIGGSGGKMAGIVRIVCERLQPGGRIVINAATLESLHTAVEILKGEGFVVDITMINVARSKDILNLTRFEALNPVFIVTGRREQ